MFGNFDYFLMQNQVDLSAHCSYHFSTSLQSKMQEHNDFNPVFEHSDTLSFALLACIVLYINGKKNQV